MDTIVIINLFIIIIALVALGIDYRRNREGYESWKDFSWFIFFLVLPIGFIYFHLYY